MPPPLSCSKLVQQLQTVTLIWPLLICQLYPFLIIQFFQWNFFFNKPKEKPSLSKFSSTENTSTLALAVFVSRVGGQRPKDTTLDTQQNRVGSDMHYAPVEQQYLAIKAEHTNAVLFMERDYKYQFFGEDAEIASKLLNVNCFPDYNFKYNFKSGSIPVHRFNVHICRLACRCLYCVCNTNFYSMCKMMGL